MLTKTGTRVLLALLALFFLAGCAITKTAETQFWPSPPDPPRIQFLKKITNSADVEEVKSWSLLNTGESPDRAIPIVKPYGVAVKKGKIYICDTIQVQVVILDLPRKKASTLKGNKGEGQLKKPISVAVDDDGFVYVADTVRKQVLKYAPDGSFLKGIGADLAMKPVGVAVDDLYLYVLDGEKRLVHVFDRTSAAQVRSFGQDGDERGQLFTPLGIGLDGKGGIYVTNLDGRIVQFDRDGHSRRMFGKMGTGFSEFNRPRAITFDGDGRMYVVDAASQNVRIMDEMFRLLLAFGDPGTIGSLNVPAGIAISTDDLPYYQQLAAPDFVLERVLFVVSQFGENKVSIYGLGKKKGVDYEALLAERQAEIRKREEAIIKSEKEKEDKEKALKEKEDKEKERTEKGLVPAQGKGDPLSGPGGKQ